MQADATIEMARRFRQPLVEALAEAGADVSKPTAIRCPWHEDKHPSAGIYEDKGIWRFKCQAACCGLNLDVWDVRARNAKRPLNDVLSEASGKSKAKWPDPKELKVRSYPTLDHLVESFLNVDRIHRYANPDEPSATDLLVIRWRETPDGPKRFVQCHRLPDGSWVPKAPPKPWPLYNRIRVRDAETVVFVEGEKCVEALAQFRIVATTSPGGALKAEHCDLSPLAGKKIILWPDNDPPDAKGRRTGLIHMRDVQRRLEVLTPKPRISWLDPDALNLPPKGDAADLVEDAIERFGDEAAQVVQETIAVAEPIGPRSELRDLLADTISGRRKCIPMPWSELSRHSMALMPGTTTLLCGDPGASKSFMVLTLMIDLIRSGVRCAALMLEETRAWHMCRVLAMLDGKSSMLNPEWVSCHGQETYEAETRHADMLDAVGDSMTVPARTEETTLGGVADWIEAKAADGVEVLIVDPVSMAARDGQPWKSDAEFVTRVVGALAETRSRVVLVTHPKSGSASSGVSLDALAGGAAYQRFAQTVLWIRGLKEPKEVMWTAQSQFGTKRGSGVPDRVVSILKARNGPGQGLNVAMGFDRQTLAMTEHGTISRVSSKT